MRLNKTGKRPVSRVQAWPPEGSKLAAAHKGVCDALDRAIYSNPTVGEDLSSIGVDVVFQRAPTILPDRDAKFGNERWDALIHATFSNIVDLAKAKGGEYAGDADRLANFRRNALALGVSQELVWAVYAGKHWDAIQQYIKDLQAGRTRVRAEPLEGRVDDLITYLLLFKAILTERGGK